jgi:hypothetical protein
MITAYGLLFVIYSIAAYALLLRLLLTGSYTGGIILLGATILSCAPTRPGEGLELAARMWPSYGTPRGNPT